MTAENANFKVGSTVQNKVSDYERALRKATNLKPIYFDQVVNYINNKIDDVNIRDKVMAIAKKYPHSALHRFVQNFEMIHTACIKEVSAERNSEAQHRVKPQKKLISTDELLDIYNDDDLEQKNMEEKIVEKSEESVQNIVDFQKNDEV